jgi:serine/threonine protein kinase
LWRSGDYLPVRWTAPEAIFDKQFSSASDVWSFGITMWEIFTFGEKPFKSMGIKEYKEKIRKDYNLKKNDFRCEQPIELSKATEEELKDVFSVMTKCWNINTAERPKFCTLEEDLHHFHLTGDLIGYNTKLIQ